MKKRLMCILLSVVLVMGVFSIAYADETIPDNAGNITEQGDKKEENEPTVQPGEQAKETAIPSVEATSEQTEQPVVPAEEPVKGPEQMTVPAEPVQDNTANGIAAEALEQLDDSLIAPFAAGDETTLRNDIASAAPGGVVEISNNITITVTPLTVNKNLTFRSTGGTVQLLVAGNIRHMDASMGITLTFEGVELVGNAPADGGGISTTGTGTITLNGASIKNCQATQGGGIATTGGAVFNNSTLTGNIATTGDGGGAYVLGATIISGSTISQNTATAGDGGGIYSAGTFT
ncbi:MAG: hypothetical protein VB081_06595, partial [Christensenella sp.]